MTNNFEILKGLPGTGPSPHNFARPGVPTHREGVVIRFLADSAEEWIGNFQPGHLGLTAAFTHPHRSEVIVVAKGIGYVVNTISKELVLIFGGEIRDCFSHADKQLLIFLDDTHFEAFGEDGRIWQTRRISWDGFRNIEITSDTILGEAFSPITNEWSPFLVHLATGSVEGGSYDEQ